MHNRVAIHDPVTSAFKPLAEAVQNAGAIVMFAGGHKTPKRRIARHRHLRKIVDKGRPALINLAYECINAPEGEVTLGALVKQFSNIEELFNSTQLALEAIIVEFLNDLEPELKAQVTELPAVLFDTLRAKVFTVTPSHVALQSHFEHMVLNGPSSMNIGQEDRAIFFAPLVALRDEYFTSAQGELLPAYLRTAEELLDTPTYKLYGPLQKGGADWAKTRQLELETLTADLEVLSMLAALDESAPLSNELRYDA
jgi:hypothetical protein